ncbi:ESX secretion-associated protein EspG [Goodfellowiella coeruleoviolacea]|uniref:EspG family protein n=1 Tax=Goodfellowiella coeruleoviolacea TaxID=334858 RepID=A0AAE3GFT0_9PSEU|nr:ESX secretion-associated protein EspG [Goodfellowiella coeruleoviolacea]MCP2165358.1 EspG family protein [Goodfellowiella coeruleoviolacea]
MSSQFTLSWLEYDFLWENLGLGAKPTVLAIDGHGYTRDERAQLRAQAWSSLRDKGFGQPGDWRPELERCLVTLARPEWEVDARLHLDAHGPRVSGLAASAGLFGVLARLDAQALTLRPVAASGLAGAAVSLLPEHRVGPGKSVTMPAEQLDRAAAQAGSDRVRLAANLVSTGLSTADAQRVAAVLGNVVRFGQFGVARTARPGARARAGHVVSFYDNPEGRYLFTRRPSGGGDWVTLAGADTAGLVRQISELVTALGD